MDLEKFNKNFLENVEENFTEEKKSDLVENNRMLYFLDLDNNSDPDNIPFFDILDAKFEKDLS